jgi:hypothetical protein
MAEGMHRGLAGTGMAGRPSATHPGLREFVTAGKGRRCRRRSSSHVYGNKMLRIAPSGIVRGPAIQRDHHRNAAG